MKAAVSVRVPGKVMLCGEYSVLAGGRALASTLDRHLAVRVRPRAGIGGAHVASDLWAEPRFVSKDSPPTQDPLLDAVAQGMRLFGVHDLELRIDSELEITLGIGSSSALRLGVLMALDELARLAQGEPHLRPRDELEALAKEAYLLQKKAQSRASGYDIATQLRGGLVEFEMGDSDESWPRRAEVCDPRVQRHLPQLVHLFGGGGGAPTGPLLSSMWNWLASEQRLASLHAANEALRLGFLEALTHPDDSRCLGALYQAARIQRHILKAGPGFPVELAEALEALPGCDQSWSFKTTGAGGEDALLLLGKASEHSRAEEVLRQAGWLRIAVGFESAGARVTRGAKPHVT